MDIPLLFGSVVLHAKQKVPALELPILHGLHRNTGEHVRGRYNGRWFEYNEVPSSEIYLPQRYKRMMLCTTHEEVRQPLTDALSLLDSQYEDAPQLYKLGRIIYDIPLWHASVVNISSTSTEGEPVSGAFYLLSSQVPMYFGLLFDIERDIVQLVWSTVNFKPYMQSLQLFNYVFYPFTPILDRPIFIKTQAVCSKWWSFTQAFGNSKYGLLRAANAMELLLYKDHTVVRNW